MEKDYESRIAQSMVVKGAVECQGRLVLAGVLEGSVSGGILKIDETGRLSGEVYNREVECAGKLQGDIVTESFILRPTGCHMGTAQTRKLIVDPGAVLDCVLQSGLSAPEKASAVIDRPEGEEGIALGKVLTAFQEETRPCCMDIPWSSRLELFNQVMALLLQGRPLLKVIGEAGSGKSVMVEKLRRKPSAGCAFFRVDCLVESVDELLQAVAMELGLAAAGQLAPAELISQLKDLSAERRNKGERVVLLVDEAEAMDPAVMEAAVRFLTNAFDGGDEMPQLVLFGTKELDTAMSPTLRQYFEAETDCQLRLAPLTVKDTADYLRFCLQLAAAGDGSASLAFLPYETIRTLHVLSRGNLARINRLADQALCKAHDAGAQAIYPDYL
jgi:MSHA biogenesis protein MshM